MRTHNIHFRGEIRKKLYEYPLLPGDMIVKQRYHAHIQETNYSISTTLVYLPYGHINVIRQLQHNYCA